MKGLFLVDRGVFSHPMFNDAPFTEREAWLWLVSEAAWRDRRVRTKRGMISIKRGQLTASVRFMADIWKWSKSRVGRFLQMLEQEMMIGTENGTGQLIVTICNCYERLKVIVDSYRTFYLHFK